MSEILAIDRDGRPLRVGDRVVLIDANPRWRHEIGKEFTVAGPARFPSVHGLLNSLSLDDGIDATGRILRKIDRPEVTKWSDIERATGWHPEREREEA